MLMLCVLYCVPLFKLLYFVSGPFMVLCGLFALKRGIRNRRMGLRKFAFVLMFFGAMKPLLLDVHQLEGDILCAVGRDIPGLPCSAHGLRMLEFLCLLAFVGISIGLFQAYRKFIPDRKVKLLKPEDVNLRFWANLGFTAVVLMACWSLAPWVGALTVGHVPHIFEVVQWQEIALVISAILLFGFWKLESCSWEYKIADKKDRRTMSTKTWTPKDTLWMATLLFLVTMGLSYVSQDTLTPKDPSQQHAGPSINQIEDMLPQTTPPPEMQQGGDSHFVR